MLLHLQEIFDLKGQLAAAAAATAEAQRRAINAERMSEVHKSHASDASRLAQEHSSGVIAKATQQVALLRLRYTQLSMTTQAESAKLSAAHNDNTKLNNELTNEKSRKRADEVANRQAQERAELSIQRERERADTLSTQLEAEKRSKVVGSTDLRLEFEAKVAALEASLGAERQRLAALLPVQDRLAQLVEDSSRAAGATAQALKAQLDELKTEPVQDAPSGSKGAKKKQEQAQAAAERAEAWKAWKAKADEFVTIWTEVQKGLKTGHDAGPSS